MPDGLFLSLDGIDGTGKSTQCRLLADFLREKGHDVVTCVDPGDTPAGQELRPIVLASRHPLASQASRICTHANTSSSFTTVLPTGAS